MDDMQCKLDDSDVFPIDLLSTSLDEESLPEFFSFGSTKYDG